MSKDTILLSPKHGLNPTMMLCFYCGKETNSIALLGRLKDDAEAPHQAVVDMTPCDECAEWMEQGVILISVKDGSEARANPNPYRTGGFAVVKEEAIDRIFAPPASEHALQHRFAFLEDRIWNSIGLPEIGTETP